MKSNRAYWKYLFRNSVPFITIYLLIVVLFSSFIAPIFVGFGSEYFENSDSTSAFLHVTFFMNIIGAYLVPLFFRSKYLNKRSVDIFMSLPVKRSSAFFGDYLFGLLLVTVAFLLSMTFGGLLCLPYLHRALTWGMWGTFLGFYYLFLLAAYSFSVGVINFANSPFDSFALLFLALFAGLCLYVFIGNAFGSSWQYKANYLDCDGTGSFAVNLLALGVKASSFYFAKGFIPRYAWLYLSLHLVIGFAFFFAAYYHFRYWKAEDSASYSEGTLGYAFWLTFDFFFLTASFERYLFSSYSYSVSIFFLLLLIFSLFYFVVVFIEKRKIRLTLRLFLRYAVTFFAAFVVGMIFALVFKD